jgi:hypothetical protein
VNGCNILENNKEAKQFLDVAPPWGEPRIYGVSCFALCYVTFCYEFSQCFDYDEYMNRYVVS